MSSTENKHRNDIYGDNPEGSGRANDAIPAATVVLLRETPKIEVLMLHKTSQIAFGGMWVFPGGRIDAQDYPENQDVNVAARTAAVRETMEEAGIAAPEAGFVWFCPLDTATGYSEAICNVVLCGSGRSSRGEHRRW